MKARNPQDLHFLALCLAYNLCPPEDLQALLRKQDKQNCRLGELLVESGYITSDQQRKVLKSISSLGQELTGAVQPQDSSGPVKSISIDNMATQSIRASINPIGAPPEPAFSAGASGGVEEMTRALAESERRRKLLGMLVPALIILSVFASVVAWRLGRGGEAPAAASASVPAPRAGREDVVKPAPVAVSATPTPMAVAAPISSPTHTPGSVPPDLTSVLTPAPQATSVSEPAPAPGSAQPVATASSASLIESVPTVTETPMHEVSSTPTESSDAASSMTDLRQAIKEVNSNKPK